MSKYLFCIVGESGSGKTTITNRLETEHSLKSISSYTTRLPRYDDETGHIFVSIEDFKELVPSLVAYTLFDGNEYGVTCQQVETSDLFVVDPKGVEYLLNHYDGNKTIKVIYIKTSLSQRMDRMESRGDVFKQALDRAVNDVIEFRGFESNADFIVNNDDLDRCVSRIWNYMCEVNINV